MDLSIVVPVYNERGNLDEMHAEISAAALLLGKDYEVIYVDDGSTDGSDQLLRAIHFSATRVRVIRFRRNFGQHGRALGRFCCQYRRHRGHYGR